MVNSLDSKDLVKGILIGGVVGAAAGWIASSCCFQADTCAIEESSSKGSVAVGSILGAVLGVTAGLLLAPSSGEDLRKDLGGKYDELRIKAEKFLNELNEKGHSAASNLDDWKDSLVSLVDDLSGPKIRKQASTKINEIAEWANIGINLWQKLQKRK